MLHSFIPINTNIRSRNTTEEKKLKMLSKIKEERETYRKDMTHSRIFEQMILAPISSTKHPAHQNTNPEIQNEIHKSKMESFSFAEKENRKIEITRNQPKKPKLNGTLIPEDCRTERGERNQLEEEEEDR